MKSKADYIEINYATRDSWAWEEEGCDPASLAPSRPGRGAADIAADFERGVRPGWDWLGGGLPSGVAVVRAVQTGSAGVLAAMVAAGISFDVRPHAGEVNGDAVCLVAEALWGWAAMDLTVGGQTLLNAYAATIGALLQGGASRHVVSPVSMAESWPLVREVRERYSVKLTGWATPEFEQRAWALWEQARAEALAGERAAVVA